MTRNNRRAGLRGFAYFRRGYRTYMAILIGILNVSTTTYFLLIDSVPSLGNLFGSFEVYVISLIGVGLPLIIFVGWIHFKRLGAHSTDLSTFAKAQPYFYKYRPGFELVFGEAFLALHRLNLKIVNKEKLTPDEIEEVKSIEKKLENLIKGGYAGNPPPGVIT